MCDKREIKRLRTEIEDLTSQILKEKDPEKKKDLQKRLRTVKTCRKQLKEVLKLMEKPMFISESALESQIKAVLESNMPNDEKEGLHNLLGKIITELFDNKRDLIILKRGLE